MSLFTVSHTLILRNVLYLKGKILSGPMSGMFFFSEYRRITREDYLKSNNDEGSISFRANGKYFNLQITLHPTAEGRGIPDYINRNMHVNKDMDESGNFMYSRYMNEIAYIILTGMIVTKL